jgi:hypothetical protein
MKIYRLTQLYVFAIAFSVACLSTWAEDATDETAALAVLASADAAVYDKAMACDTLGRVGTAKAVPALAQLLTDEQLHDYARDGLERIEDLAAGQALLEALKTLKAEQRVGVIITLGDRREEAAVTALATIAKGEAEDRLAIDAALASLAQLATDEAAKAILAVLAEGDAAAAPAALAAAQRMEQDGREEAAEKLRKTLADAAGE